MNASIKHNGATRLAITGLRTLDARLMQAAGTGLAAGLQHAAGVAMQKYLSGPRPAVLDVVTGRLRGSITHAVAVTSEKITGRIGTNIPYAMVHEFGMAGHEPVRVKEHKRHVENAPNSFDRERIVKSGKNAGKVTSDLYRLDKAGNRVGWRMKLGAYAAKIKVLDLVTEQTVKEHDRVNFKYLGRPFLRPALEESGPVILDFIKRQLAAVPATA